MSRTRRTWFFNRRGKFRYVEGNKIYATDKKHVSCIRKERYIRKVYRHKIRAHNRINAAKGRYDYMIANFNQTSETEYFD